MTTKNEANHPTRLIQKCGGSETGSKWLKMAVDPFHDIDLDLVGYPDQTSGRSIIYNVTKNLTVTVPTTVPADNNWDCHVSFTPLMAESALQAYTASASAGGRVTQIINNGVQPWVTSGDPLRVCSVPAGTPTFRGGSDEREAGIGISEFVAIDGSTPFRLVGAAFEVHNTTAELDKSGAVTTYKYDTHADSFDAQVLTGAKFSTHERYDCINGPPSNVSDAKLLNGITWEARDGALVPCVMSSDNSPKKYLPRRSMMIMQDPLTPLYWTMSGLGDSNVRFGTTPTIDPVNVPLENSVILPFMGCGAYFTGLTYSTSLTITLRAFVEVFPSPSSSLVALAHPATPADFEVLTCYSKIMADIHSGYPVHDNAAGDYFKKILGAARAIAETGMLGPGAARAANIASAASAGVKTNSKSKKK
jgi:hypothetical protein